MFKVNLLPPYQKKELEISNLNHLLFFLFSWLAVFLTILLALLLSAFFSLSILLENQHELIDVRKSDAQTRRLVEIENRISQINQRLNQINLKQKDLVLWTPILEELTKITSSGIYLNSFSYQTGNSQIQLAGWASTRSQLLSFENSLKKSAYFTEVQAPLTNLIKQEDINFSFTFKPVIILEQNK